MFDFSEGSGAELPGIKNVMLQPWIRVPETVAQVVCLKQLQTMQRFQLVVKIVSAMTTVSSVAIPCLGAHAMQELRGGEP